MPTTPSITDSWLAPTERETLLLRAGILDPVEAMEYWKDLTATCEFEDLNEREVRLAPAVYHNLRDVAAGDPKLEPYAKAATRTWVWNQTTFRTFRETIDIIGAAGADPIILKGAALLPLYYSNLSARKIADVDILVEPARIGAVVEAFRELRWREADPFFDPRFFHARTFEIDGHRPLDLHHHVIHMCCWNGADERFIDGVLDAEIADRRVKTLCAADHLLHVLFHGRVWAQLPNLRWIGDAAVLMAKAPIDWQRFVDHARALQVSGAVYTALRQFSEITGQEISADVTDELKTHDPGWAARAFVSAIDTERRGRVIPTVAFAVAKFLLGVRDKTWPGRLLLLPRYARFRARTNRLALVPLSIIKRFVVSLVYGLGRKRRLESVMRPQRPRVPGP